MENLTSRLQKCSLFRDIPVETIEREILPHGKIRNVSKGEFLLVPQERLDYFGVILMGSVHTMHIFPDGVCTIIGVLEPEEVFGADLMATRSRVSPCHAMAAEPVRLLLFPVGMAAEPGMIPEEARRRIQDRLLVLLAHENMRKEYRLAILSRKGLRERIMTYLTMQANKRHTPTFTVPFNREEMASFLCVNRSALSHELSLMQAEGILSFRRNEFTLLHWTASEIRESEI